jgi:hypothetical protein
MFTLWSVALLVVLLNLPFGYWRASAVKFSRPWFLAVHIPVPFVIALRISSGLGWQLATFPVMIGAFFLGQYLGGKLHLALKHHSNFPVTACLVWDIVTGLGPGKSSVR